jgi:hypothetical protein
MLKKLGVDNKENTVKPDVAILKLYEGNYRIAPEFAIAVRVDKDRIFARATAQAEFEIFPLSETKFYYKVVDAQIEFFANDNGKFNKMILYQNNLEMPGERVE